jgi:hypothetical protein
MLVERDSNKNLFISIVGPSVALEPSLISATENFQSQYNLFFYVKSNEINLLPSANLCCHQVLARICL